MTRPRKLLRCEGNCSEDTDHQLAGENLVGRPVWVCSNCDARRVGVFVSTDVLNVAADGGDPGGER